MNWSRFNHKGKFKDNFRLTLMSHGHDRILIVWISKFGLIQTQRFLFNYTKKKWILDQTNLVLFTLAQRSINIESMREIEFLTVSAILMIISDFRWHWLLKWYIPDNTSRNAVHVLCNFLCILNMFGNK